MAFEQFPYSNFHDLNLDWILKEIKNATDELSKMTDTINGFGVTLTEAIDYINNYFDNLNVQDEINNKLQDMSDSGELANIVAQYMKAPFCYNSYQEAAADKLAQGARFIARRFYKNQVLVLPAIYMVLPANNSNKLLIPLYDNLATRCDNTTIYPEQLGAVGDGVADDTNAIVSATTYSTLKINILYTQSYNISSNIIVNKTYNDIRNATFPNKKILYEHDLQSNFNPSYYRIDLAKLNSSITGKLQSWCYNKNSNIFQICMAGDDSINGQIVTLSGDLSTVTSVRSVALYHGNDITFNPNANIYVIAPMHTNGEILICNGNFATITSKILPEFANYQVSRVSYDEDNNIYYVQAGSYTGIYDDDWKLLKYTTVDITYPSKILPYQGNNNTTQTGCVYKGCYLIGASLYQGNNLTYPSFRLAPVMWQSNNFGNILEYPLFNKWDEMEGIAVVNDDILVASSVGTLISITRLTPVAAGQPMRQNVNANSPLELWVDESKTTCGDGLSKENPYNSLQEAIDTYNGRPIHIYLLSDVKNNIKVIAAPYLVYIDVDSTKSTVNSTGSFTFDYCNLVIIKKINFNINNATAIYTDYVSNIYINECNFTGNTTSGSVRMVDATSGTIMNINSCEFTNCFTAVRSSTSSEVIAGQCTFTTCNRGASATYGGVIHANGCTFNSVTSEVYKDSYSAAFKNGTTV